MVKSRVNYLVNLINQAQRIIVEVHVYAIKAIAVTFSRLENLSQEFSKRHVELL